MRILQLTLSFCIILFFAADTCAKIVFDAYENKSNNIYVMGDKGDNITQITDSPTTDIQPRWSPDGQQIAFLRDTDPTSSIVYNAFIMNADGTHVRQLTNYQGCIRGLAFSTNGDRLIVSLLASGKIGLFHIDINTGEQHKISRLEMDEIDWSPDGKKIVFVNTDLNVTEANIWMMDADGNNAHAWIPPIRLPRTMTRNSPRWSPNGKQILYTETDRNVQEQKFENGGVAFRISYAGTFRYKIRNIDGGTKTLNIEKDWVPKSIAWMNRGRSVLFCAFDDFEHLSDRDRAYQLYRYDLATRKITQLTHGPASKGHADWVYDVHAVSPMSKHTVRWGELKKAY